MVMDHDMRYIIQAHNMLKEKFGEGRSTYLILPSPARNKSTDFAKFVHANQKCIKSINARQSGDKIHHLVLKLVMWYR